MDKERQRETGVGKHLNIISSDFLSNLILIHLEKTV